MQSLHGSLVVAILLCCGRAGHCLDNGLARTPPMGWLTWERFACTTDCNADPQNCVSEKLIMAMADRMAEDGYRDVGYEYVTMDDCWLAPTRDSNGSLQPDPDRFPHGIAALADYVHQRGLKLGIYEAVGTRTCAGYPGSEGNYDQDARTFASWGIDLLKFDGCYTNDTVLDQGYPAMSVALNKTGRQILYSCEWPLYSSNPNYTVIAQYCNIFRNHEDIDDDWDSVYSIIEYYASDAQHASEFAAPGSFNDPDMLMIGNYGLSIEQQKTQMAMWAMFAAPLIMSTDLRSIDPMSRSILLNKNVIAIDQDPLGIQGHRVYQYNGMEAFFKPLQGGGGAIAILHHDPFGPPLLFQAPFGSLGLKSASSYTCFDAFSGQDFGNFTPSSTLRTRVNPSGSTVLLTCAPLSSSNQV